MKFFSDFSGVWGKTSPTSGKGCGTFLKSGYPLALLAKFVNGKNGNNLASGIFRNVYTLALLADNVITKYEQSVSKQKGGCVFTLALLAIM